MTKIEKLIQELCPNGVEYKTLGEVFSNIETGKLDANKKDENGLYPFFTCDSEHYWINEYSFDEDAIIISGNGSKIGHIHHYNGKFNAYQRTYVLYNIKFLQIRFCFFYFKSFLKDFIIKNSKTSSIPYITMPKLQSFLIPIPPIEVQEEIVRILDNFTALEAELEAELEARTKQYTHYRDSLLSFSDSVPIKSIGEIYYSSSGLSKPANEFGKGYPFLSFKTVFNNRVIPDKIVDLVNATENEKNRNSIQKGDVFVTRTSENIEELGMACASLKDYPQATFNGFTKRLRPKEGVLINPKYTVYFFSSSFFRNQIKKIAIVSTRVSLNDSILLKIQIPLPPLAEQERIVAILDKFDALVNDLSSGLPAEIKARRQQYEYYRDKLLSFKKIS